MKKIILPRKLSDDQLKELHGNYIDESYIDHLLEEDTIAYNEEGKPIAVFIKNCIPSNIAESAYYSLKKAVAKSNNRGMAAGPLNAKVGDVIDGMTVGKMLNGNRFQPLKKDGTLSNSPKAKAVNSSIIGYSDRYARIPYCRTTEFTYKHFETYKKAVPYVQYISKLFKENLPDRWQNQKNEWDKTHNDFKIQNTVFTTVTVNKNFRTACHYDSGDLFEGFGNLAVLETGKYSGGYTVIPKYGVAVNVRNCDLALFDVHELHANTEIKSDKLYERISIVCYFRKKMTQCGSAEEELQRIKYK
tara:strand:+ start:941 stop:1846 length:906 start_codon:yes stop_codon:yes gene_type:complete